MTNKAMTDILLVIFFALVFARSAKDIGAWIWESISAPGFWTIGVFPVWQILAVIGVILLMCGR
jgi:hypothetical protein